MRRLLKSLGNLVSAVTHAETVMMSSLQKRNKPVNATRGRGKLLILITKIHRPDLEQIFRTVAPVN